MTKRYSKLPERERDRIEATIKMLLHASRDAMRNRNMDTTKISFDATDGYYGEAFGVMRGLEALGYGYFGSDNVPDREQPHSNLKHWFHELTQTVLLEEHFGEDWEGTQFAHQCEHCLKRYGKDAVRQRRSQST